jgi:UDP-glucose 4-epimerase
LLIGASGFVGSSLLGVLSANYRQVIAVTSRPLEHTKGTTNIENVVTDLSEPEVTQAQLCRSDKIIYLASRTTPSASAARPSMEVEMNLLPLASFIEQLHGSEAKQLIYISSGGAIYQPGAVPHSEQRQLYPISYYAAGKIAAETFLRVLSAQTNHRVVVVRPGNLYGAGQSAKKGFGIIPTVFTRLKSGEKLTIWGDGESLRDYLYIDDFTDLLLRVLGDETEGERYRVVNAGTGIGTSLNQLCDMIEQVAGEKLSRQYLPARGVDVEKVVLDASLAAELYDWQASTPIKRGLEKVWDRLRDE